MEAAILLRLVERHLAGVPALSSEELVSDQWIQAVAEATPIARFRDTPFERPIDGRFHKENAFRKYAGLPLFPESEDSLQKYYRDAWGLLDDELDSISSDLRRHLLLPDEQAGPDAAARLSEFLPDALDLLEEDLAFVDGDREQLSVRLGEHMALIALAAEGIVKHELVGDELIRYIVNLLLPAA